MKKLLLFAAILGLFAGTQTANATTFGDSTNHWDGWNSSDSWQDTQDVLGHPDITGGSITTNQAGLLTSITFTADSNWPYGGWTYNGSTLASGDLFINIINSANDNTWDYLVRTFNSKDAGYYTLYNISLLGISDQPIYGAAAPGNVFQNVGPYITGYGRNNQPVAIQNSYLSNLSTSQTAYFSGLYANDFSTTYSFDGLDVGSDFVIAWGLTCGNDIVHERTPVPEPSTFILLGAGLAGLGFARRRLSKKA